jgi:UrcA family protein
MRLTIPLALVALAAPAAADATARGAHSASQAIIQLGDLNLARPTGADAALARIRFAAGRLCGPDAPPVEVEWRRVCIDGATEMAVRQLRAPLVTARFYATAPMRSLAAN